MKELHLMSFRSNLFAIFYLQIHSFSVFPEICRTQDLVIIGRLPQGQHWGQRDLDDADLKRQRAKDVVVGANPLLSHPPAKKAMKMRRISI